MENQNTELEQFRKQWRAEVTARSKTDNQSRRTTRTSRSTRKDVEPPRSTALAPVVKDEDEDEDDGEEEVASPDIIVDDIQGFGSKSGSREPRSALEHYEMAVEKEAQGSLGDSLDLYRKAFRMDNRVDLKYKNKHFPPSSVASKPTDPNPSNAAVTVPNPAHHSLDGPPKTITELIAGFSGLVIEAAPPEVEGTPTPPCPISTLPDEILVHIMIEVAISDITSFVRLAQVCKRLAYLVATEEQVWKRVCIGSEFGFGAMHYKWQQEIEWGPLEETLGAEESTTFIGSVISTDVLLNKSYSASWHKMFRFRPRIRFNGCYISTVNYIRPGQASPSQVTWNSPVHIVTYYRYLRFFRDGTVISLLTTTEPTHVVHYLSKDFQAINKHSYGAHPPSPVMQTALRGRWRLSSTADNPDADPKDAEGDVYVETEGVGTKYVYRMELTLRSSGKAAKNNKLVWRGFWNYNKLTDDWGEFGLRNDKAFFWSRVKSYGLGG